MRAALSSDCEQTPMVEPTPGILSLPLHQLYCLRSAERTKIKGCSKSVGRTWDVAKRPLTAFQHLIFHRSPVVPLICCGERPNKRNILPGVQPELSDGTEWRPHVLLPSALRSVFLVRLVSWGSRAISSLIHSLQAPSFSHFPFHKSNRRCISLW